MSWQVYVVEHLMCEIDDNYLTSATIIGHDSTVWAQSSSFPPLLPPSEINDTSHAYAFGVANLWKDIAYLWKHYHWSG